MRRRQRNRGSSSAGADVRIYGIGDSLLDTDCFLIGTKGNLHARDTLWHGIGLWAEKVKAVKLAFYPRGRTGEARRSSRAITA